MNVLSREHFQMVAARGVLVPVYRELAADLETPVSVYLKLRGQGPSFLLESVEKAEQVGRYSFLGFNPRREITTRDRSVTILDNGQAETRQLAAGEDPLDVVATELKRYQPVAPIGKLDKDLPRFFGGAVGYLGYDLVRFFEHLPETTHDELNLPDLHLLMTDTLVIFDHVRHRLLVVANSHVPPESDLDAAYDDAIARLDEVEEHKIRTGFERQPQAGVAVCFLERRVALELERVDDAAAYGRVVLDDENLLFRHVRIPSPPEPV